MLRVMIQDAIHVQLLIVGAGISGIGAAIRARAQGIDSMVVLEKADSLGGTWRDNTYPGCACDVPSALYSYSFAQKPDWSRVFATQPEIMAYVRDTAERFDVTRFIHFGRDVLRASWQESQRHWLVQTTNGTYRADVVISCAGYLHEPQIPKLPGLDAFQGALFHSSRWRHDLDLTGKRVAVIGTGASAIQFVPKIQPKVRSLALFQRTPQWILPKPDVKLGGIPERLLSLPNGTQLAREFLYRGLEEFGSAFRHPKRMRAVQRVAELHLRASIKDPALRKKLTPDYVLGCKRLLLSNDYYPAVAKANVEVLHTGVREVRGNTVLGADGSAREVDTIILGTGFHVADAPMAQNVYGKEGRSLAEVWAGSPEAYRGTTITGFPNSFMVLGPNLGIGHNSAFIVIEAQLDYIFDALKIMRKQGIARLEVRSDVQQSYNREVQRDLQTTVWNVGGCSSYYIDGNGKNSVAFPYSTRRMRRLLERFDLTSYHADSTVRTNLSKEVEEHV